MKIKVTAIYPYEGDETNEDKIIAYVTDQIQTGKITLTDLIASSGTEVSIETLGEVFDEDVMDQVDDDIVEDYRERYPKETNGLTDRQVYDIVMATEDDMEDDEWKKLFRKAQKENADAD